MSASNLTVVSMRTFIRPIDDLPDLVDRCDSEDQIKQILQDYEETLRASIAPGTAIVSWGPVSEQV